MANDKTYNRELAAAAQAAFTKEKGYPHFAPNDGECWSCHNNIYDPFDNGRYIAGISVEQAGSELVTGCPHCCKSYCN